MVSEFLNKYGKIIVAAVGAVVALGISGIYDDGFQQQDLWATLAAILAIPTATWYAPAKTANT